MSLIKSEDKQQLHKLYITQNSPYARIARIALRETGYISSVAELEALNRQDDNPVLEFSPVGRVPTLVADGFVITETRRVVEYIAKATGYSELFQLDQNDWSEIEQEGQIIGFMDGIAFQVRENRRGDLASDFQIVVERKRCGRCLQYFESQAALGHLAALPAFRSIALAVSLELMDAHDFYEGWQERHNALASWFKTALERSSMIATRPVV